MKQREVSLAGGVECGLWCKWFVKEASFQLEVEERRSDGWWEWWWRWWTGVRK